MRATEEAVTLANTRPAVVTGPRRRPAAQANSDAGPARRGRAAVERFDTRVTVSLGKRKGRIVVEFGSVEDLQRILDRMDPGKA